MGLRDRILGKRTPEDAFAAEVAGLVRELLPVESVKQNDDFSLAMTFDDGETQTMFLHNIYAEAAQADGEEREARLRTAVLGMMPRESPATWDAASPRLMPAIRAVSWTMAAGLEALPLARRGFAPFLVALTAIDDEHSMAYVTEPDLERWQVDGDTVMATAVANLHEHGIPVERDGVEPRLDILGPDGYASSWLAAPGVLASIGGRLDDAFVILTPHRDELRLVGTSDRAVLKRELELALEDYQAAPRQLSPVPYELGVDGVVEWEPAADDPCRALVDRAKGVLAAVEYAVQEQWLAEALEQAGEDVYVAKLGLMEGADGGTWSWATWTRQVATTLLPRVDYLGMADLDEGSSFVVRWTDAERIAPASLALEPGYEPPRWRVTGWPDEPVLAQLRDAAVDLGGG